MGLLLLCPDFCAFQIFFERFKHVRTPSVKWLTKAKAKIERRESVIKLRWKLL